MSSDAAIFATILCCCLIVQARPVVSDLTTSSLKARPETCVALHKGQRCYARIRLSWSDLPESRFCLYAVARDEQERLACWSGMQRDHLVHEYAAAASVDYRLVDEVDDFTLGNVTVRTGWVYRSSRRSASGWRLF